MAGSFGAIDYLIFIGTIVISLSVGIFFAVLDKKKKRSSSNDYFLAGQSSRTLPVTLSFVVTFQSSLMILANPVEVYNYGMTFSLFSVGLMLAYILAGLVIVPVLYPLKVTSVNKYLFLRYGDNLVRYLAVFTGVIFSVFYMGTVIFGTCVAVEVVMGIPYWITVLVFTIVTTIYTSIGGIKAVIWTDVFQFIIMTSGVVAVLIKSTIEAGGAANVTKLGQQRLAANQFSFDPTVRYTIWNVPIGSFSMFLYLCISQSGFQRIRTTPNISAARLVYILGVPVFAILQTLCCFEGVTLFAYHASRGCDILHGGVVENVNELLPFTITQLFDGIPGINGLFIASLSSAALSTLSSCLGSLSAITYEDVIRVKYPDMDDGKATLLSKFTVLVYGLVGMILTFVIAKLPGSIVNIFQGLIGCMDGPTSAIFVLSVLFKRGTSKGVFLGALCGMAVSFWLFMGKSTASIPADPQLPPGPIDKCWQYTNATNTPIAINGSFETNLSYNMTGISFGKDEIKHNSLSVLEKLYTISYILFSFIGFMVTIIASMVISYLTKSTGAVEEKYVFSFRKHILTDLFGRTSKTESIKGNDEYSFTAEEMTEFVQT